MKRAVWAFALTAALLVLAYLAYTRLGGAQTPVGQLSLTDLGRSGFGVYEQMFNDASDRVRVVALFSPT